MPNLALKYRPKDFSDVVEQDNVVKILKSMCEQPELPNRNFLLVGPRGCGKAQPDNSLVLTPNGFITMGNVRVGTEVITHGDEIGKVSGVFPQGKRQCYRLEFDDGGWCEVSDNHINFMEYSYDGVTYQHKDIATLDLLSEFNSKNNKKIWGVKQVVCTFDKDKDFEIKDIPTSYSILMRNYQKWLNSNKQSRIRIFDKIYQDFGISNNGSTYLFNINEFFDDAELALEFISRSLGYGFKKSGSNIEVNKHCLNSIRKLVKIKKIGYKACTCIYVDHPDHTYITDDFIPTHNTTLGRIVANKINDGKGTPLELDAASNSGVDTVRVLMDKAHEFPVGSKYKVFIFDEVHAFSATAWQSMLKTFEDQPAKSVFILLTTNPEKIPATILSRVQKFQLSNISMDGIVNRLEYVISQENNEGRNITYDEQALAYIAKLAKGGMRDSLTLLDKALVYSNDITFENLQVSLGIPDYNDYFDLLNAYAKKDNLKIIQTVEKIYNSGTNFVKWFEEFQSFVINIVKYVYLHDITETTIPITYQDKVSKYGPKHAMICLQLSQLLVEMIAKISRTEYMEEVADSYLMR